MKQSINEEFKRMQKLAGIITEDITNLTLKEAINNKYTFKDVKLSDESGDFYKIDTKKAFDYLKQFNSEQIDAKQFIEDDEGWGEFEQYILNVEQMSDEELEDSMRSEMSFYYFSDGDSI
jgi:hypothetical protein